MSEKRWNVQFVYDHSVTIVTVFASDEESAEREARSVMQDENAGSDWDSYSDLVVELA